MYGFLPASRPACFWVGGQAKKPYATFDTATFDTATFETACG
jgi:hypothetical protein